MRVIAGSAGGRKLIGPPTTATRPMTDRTREAIFNSLNSLGVVEEAKVLDLFAGTGALGIEALSRAANSCVFVERDRKTVEVINENLHVLGFGAQAKVITADVLSYVSTAERFDLAFIAPPYAFEDWAPILDHLTASIAVCESERSLVVPDRWQAIRIKKYGQTEITMLESVR